MANFPKNQHLRGKKCKSCGYEKRSIPGKSSKELFIKKSMEIHGKKYDYSKVEYIDNKTKVIIICPKHGEFSQRPNQHLRGQGCPERKRTANKIDIKKFIKRANIKHGFKYDYSKAIYIDRFTPIEIVCERHGSFFQKPVNHLEYRGCRKCGYETVTQKRSSNTEEFILKSKINHGERYDYSRVEYVNNKKEVILICKDHGEFEQLPNTHLGDHGCPTCAFEIHQLHETVSNLIKSGHNPVNFFYVIRLYNSDECFFKIGRTSKKKITERFFKTNMPYELETLEFVKTRLQESFNLEQKILKELRHLSYKPKVYFGGHSECFISNPLLSKRDLKDELKKIEC